MDDNKGGYCQESTHEVKTLQKAMEWTGELVERDKLPLRIEQRKTKHGRLYIRIYDCCGKLIKTRG